MDELLNRVDELGNSFFLRLEAIDKNEQLLLFLGSVTAVVTYGKMKSGVMHSPLFTLLGMCKPRTEITGFVKDGYEEARAEFEKVLNEGMEENLQTCAYVNGELVLDLVGRVDSANALSQKYTATSIQNVFSSSKAVASVVVAMLVDRGQLTYDMKIVDIWPEFGQHGKEMITVEELVKHEAGMEKFSFSLTAEDLHRNNLKRRDSRVSTQIAGATSSRTSVPASSPPPRAYHAVTRDFIVNEVVMRADPLHRTLGEFLRDEICAPLGLQGQLTMGCETAQHQDKVYPLTGNSVIWVALQFFNRLNPKLDIGHCFLQLILLNMGLGFKLASWVLGPKYAVPSLVAGSGEDPFMEVVDVFNHPSVRNCEAPSANMHANARALARLAAVMAGDGTALGVTLLTPETVANSHIVSEADVKFDSILNGTTKFNRGGWNVFDRPDFCHYRHGMVGWLGIGGSVLMWHRELKIGFGWANSLMAADVSGPNAAAVQNAVTKCALQAAENAV